MTGYAGSWPGWPANYEAWFCIGQAAVRINEGRILQSARMGRSYWTADGSEADRTGIVGCCPRIKEGEPHTLDSNQREFNTLIRR